MSSSTGEIDRSLQQQSLRIIYAFEALAAVFVALRVWARCILAKGSWTGLMVWSDVFMGIAFLLSIGETIALAQVTTRLGLGLHLTDIIATTPTDLKQQVISNQWNIANQLLYNPLLAFVKISVICLYLRLVAHKRELRLACYGVLIFNCMLMVATFVADALQCLPFEYNWNKPFMDIAAREAVGADPVTGMLDGVLITGGKCFHQSDFYVATAGLGLLTDIMVMAIPVAMVWGLQMKLKKKIVVVGILTLGLSVTAVGIARLPIVHTMFSPKTADPFYTIGFTTSSMETGLAIATACVPDLTPLAARLFPQYFGSSAHPSSYPTHNRKGYTNNGTNNLGYAPGTFGGGRDGAIKLQSTVRNKSLDGSEGSDEIGGDNYIMQGWRGDTKKMGSTNVDVKGGSDNKKKGDVSRSGSQEHIVPKEGITKTTQFVIQDDRDEDGKRWSAV